MRILKSILSAALTAYLIAATAMWPALAQTSPNLVTGQVPTAAQWNSYFASKQDVLGYTPLNIAGGTMTGRLVTAAASASGSGLRLPQGAAPTSPVNGDLWTTSAGIYVRINDSTIQLLGATSFTPGQVYGNSTALTTNGAPSSLGSIFDRAFCSTNLNVIMRSSGSWLCHALMAAASVTSGNAVCFSNTTGTLADCGFTPSVWQVPLNTLAIGKGSGTGFYNSGPGLYFASVYGALCDNSADDGPAIRSAVAAAQAAGGGTVMVPEGFCKVNTTTGMFNTAINVPSKVSVRGVGKDATWIVPYADNLTLLRLSGSWSKVEDMSFASSSAGTSAIRLGQLDETSTAATIQVQYNRVSNVRITGFYYCVTLAQGPTVKGTDSYVFSNYFDGVDCISNTIGWYFKFGPGPGVSGSNRNIFNAISATGSGTCIGIWINDSSYHNTFNGVRIEGIDGGGSGGCAESPGAPTGLRIDGGFYSNTFHGLWLENAGTPCEVYDIRQTTVYLGWTGAGGGLTVCGNGPGLSAFDGAVQLIRTNPVTGASFFSGNTYKWTPTGTGTTTVTAQSGVSPNILWATLSGTVPTTATAPMAIDAVTGAISGPWSASGSDIYRASGLVGICSAPSTGFQLDVNCSSAVGGRVKTSSGNARFDIDSQAGSIAQLLLVDGGTSKWSVRKTAANLFSIYDVVNSLDRLTVASTGAVSIGGTLTLGSALTYGGVTLSNAVTGTGPMALGAGPSFSGTVRVTGGTNPYDTFGSGTTTFFDANGNNLSYYSSGQRMLITAGGGVTVGSSVTGGDKGNGTVSVQVGYYADGTAGASATVSVRKGDNSGACNLVYSMGLYISTTC